MVDLVEINWREKMWFLWMIAIGLPVILLLIYIEENNGPTVGFSLFAASIGILTYFIGINALLTLIGWGLISVVSAFIVIYVPIFIIYYTVNMIIKMFKKVD